MASTGSLNGSNSLLLQGTASCWKFPSSDAWRGVGFSNCGARACRISFRRSCGNGVLSGLSLMRRGERKGLMKMNCKAEGSEGKEEESIKDDEDTKDDALRATIQTSKKMLAKQKDLLQKIVANRKLVSSIESSVLNTDLDTDSYDGRSERSYLKADQTSTSEQLDQKYSIDDNSDTHAKTKLTGPPSSIDGSLLGGKRERKTSSEAKFSVAAALGLVKEKTTTATPSKTTLPFLPKSSVSTDAKDGKLEDLAAANVEDVAAANVDDVSGKHVVDSEEGNHKPLPLAGINVMNVILVAAECAPWSKTGGLGDVAGALPKALARRGHRVMVVVPRYGDYAEPKAVGVRKRYRVSGQDMEVTYFHAYIDGVDFVFIDSPIFWHRQTDIYGGNRQDILKRMILFCKAAVEVPWHVPCGGVCYGDGNLVFIANDWHTALLPVYLKAYYRDHGLMKYARCVLVIHNMAHQGRGPPDDFFYVDLPKHYMDLFKLYDPLGGDHFNLFAAGLKTADRVVTVSHGYAWELKTSEGGWGLHGIINENDWKLQGIVNGIDTEDWNPEVDVHLKSDGYTNYSLETLKAGKAKCKAALQRELGLAVRENVPIVAFIGRLDHQKGVDLIGEAMPWIVNQDLQLVMLGAGRPDLEDMVKRFERQHHDKVRGWVGFSVKMAHRITAGADILIMPSRFEPCGLNQLYAMAYGTVPVVHRVGGLRDTVIQFDPYKETGFGWAFDKAEAGRLIVALGNSLNTYWNYKNSWEGLQRRGMMQDLSWDNAAQQYEQVLVAAKYQW